jgi:hypothetical protein
VTDEKALLRRFCTALPPESADALEQAATERSRRLRAENEALAARLKAERNESRRAERERHP